MLLPTKLSATHLKLMEMKGRGGISKWNFKVPTRPPALLSDAGGGGSQSPRAQALAVRPPPFSSAVQPRGSCWPVKLSLLAPGLPICQQRKVGRKRWAPGREERTCFNFKYDPAIPLLGIYPKKPKH